MSCNGEATTRSPDPAKGFTGTAQWACVSSIVILLDARGRRHLVPLNGPMVRVQGLGTFQTSKLRDAVGRRIAVGGKHFLVLTPSLRDLRDTLARIPQTLTSKDLAVILFETDIRSGHRVVEAGSGAGALTIALARGVAPSGRVYSYEIREDFQAVARSNVSRAGLSELVDFRTGDVRKDVLEQDIDAVVLDIPDPWAAIDTAWSVLRPCGHLASFSPNMEQVKQTVAAIRAMSFVDVRTVEVIEREMEVREVGVRPSFAPLGHTGYLTFARKVLDTF